MWWWVSLKKIRVVVADSNHDYLKSFVSFTRTSHNDSRFVFTYFSDQQILQEYIDHGHAIDLLLISPDLHESVMNLADDVLIVLLEDDILSDDDRTFPGVYRYQRLSQLLSNLIGLYYEHNEAAERQLVRSKQAKVISVYSPVGGTGKTTVAANLSKQLALNGSKVFYLNLETINSSGLFFSSEEDNPSLQIFYYAKSDFKQLLSKIETLKKHDAYAMVDYFDIEINAEEMLEMRGEEVKRIINGIVKTGEYNYIIVDLDSSLHERNRTALTESDNILWIMTNDNQSILKTKALLDKEEDLFGKKNIIRDRMTTILNKFTGAQIGDMDDLGVTIDGYLPFISAWLVPQTNDGILGNDRFNQEIQTIARNIIVYNKEGVATGGL